MARVKQKRKAQDALGGTKSDNRRNVSISHMECPPNNCNQEEDGDDGGLFVRQSSAHQVRVIKNPSTARSKTLQLAAQSEEDERKTDNKQSSNFERLQNRKLVTKKKLNKYLEDFKHTVECQGLKTKKEFEDLTSQCLTDDNGFLATFQSTHHSIMIDGLVTTGQNNRESHSLKDDTKSAISNARQVLEGFDKSVLKVSSQKPFALLFDQKWAKESHDTERMLQMGRRVGESQITAILAGPQASEAGPDYKKVSETLFLATNKTAEDVTWAEVAKEQEKLVKRLVATLPPE